MDTRIFSEEELFSLLTGCFEYMDIMETTGVEPLDYMEMLDIHTIHVFYAMPAEEQARFRDLVMQIVRDNKGAFEKLQSAAERELANDMEGWTDEGLQDSGNSIAYWENAIECLLPALHRYLREG